MSVLRSSRLLAAGTGVRILLAPVVMALVLHGSDTAAAAVFFVAAATDWIDGRLARRWGVTTRLGAFLDTTADKLLVTTALVALVAVDRVSPWIALIIMGREFTILGLRAAVAVGRPALRDLDARQVEGDDPVRGADHRDAAPRRDRSPAPTSTSGAWSSRRIVTAWSGVDYLMKFSASLRSAS